MTELPIVHVTATVERVDGSSIAIKSPAIFGLQKSSVAIGPQGGGVVQGTIDQNRDAAIEILEKVIEDLREQK